MVEVVATSNPTEYDLMLIFAEDSDSANKWRTLTIGTGRRAGTFQIIITRQHNPNMTDSLAVDNIKFSNCAYTAPHDKTKKQCPNGQFTCGNHYNCIPLSKVW